MPVKDLDKVSQKVFQEVVAYAEDQLGYDEKKVKQLYGYVFLEKSEVKGYVLYKKMGRAGIYVDWIYAFPGYGMRLMKHVEKNHKKITLKCSIDPGEKLDTVMRRINFYIKLNYRVTDIKFREKHGPILTMVKTIS